MKKSRLLDLAVLCFFILCVAGIYITNLKGNFYLTGWDNLHPEFDYKTNISRSFFSAWQEYQGVGLPAGNAHATELLREVILKSISPFLAIHEVRKIFFLLMLLIGPLGIYFLLKNIFFNEKPLYEKVGLGTIGGIVYLFHIATVQIFYTPYESFAGHYAFLPWMIFSVLLYLHRPSKKSILFLFLIHLIGSIQFYIPTLFIVYCLAIFVIIITTLLRQGKYKELIGRCFVLVLCILIANSYWLLPFLNYTLSNILSQLNSYNNLMYSEDIYLANLKIEGLKNAVLFKGFLIDYGTINSKPGYMMSPWRNYMESPLFIFSGIFFFILVLVGTVRSLLKKNSAAIGILFLLFFSLLAINVPPFSFINELLRKNALFHQVFRNPFTKFGTMLLLVETLLFTFGIEWIIKLFNDAGRVGKKHFMLACIIAVFVLQNLSLFPLWQGYFIYPTLEKQIPREYFDLFAYFKNKEDGRIANLPQINSNGWYSYQWGYEGSGFLWYGIKQPILDRSFDVWHKDNENYYWEVSQAIYSDDAQSLQNVFEKYQVKWLIVDGNISTSGPSRSSYLEKTLTLLDTSHFATLEKTFGKIKVYEVTSHSTINQFILLKNDLPHVTSSYKWNYVDKAFADYGYYSSDVQNIDADKEIYYPLRSLFTNRSQSELEFQISDQGSYYSIKKSGFTINPSSSIQIPAMSEDELSLYNTTDLKLKSSLIPSLFINAHQLEYTASVSSNIQITPSQNSFFEARIPKIDSIYSDRISPVEELPSLPLKSCNVFNDGIRKLEVSDSADEPMMRATSIKSSNCFAFDLPYLSQRFGYLISIKNRNVAGRGMLLSIRNKTSGRVDLEEYLPENKSENTSWFLLTPKEKYGLGYYLEFDNISLVEGNTTINELGEITVQPVPLSFLNSIKIIGQNISSTQNDSPNNAGISVVHHYDPNVYWIQLSSPPSSVSTKDTLILSQAFHTGWMAFMMPNGATPSHLFSYLAPIIGTKINSHLLINNWENGWIVPPTTNGSQIVIIFLPQYLEFAGFILIILTLGGIVLWRKK